MAILEILSPSAIPVPLNMHPGAKYKTPFFTKGFQPATPKIELILFNPLRHQKHSLTIGLPQYAEIVENFIHILGDVQDKLELKIIFAD